MRHIVPLYLALACFATCLLTACSEDERPTSLLPTFRVDEASEVTRNGALLSGEVMVHGNGTVSEICFRYGTTTGMEQTAPCPDGTLRASARLTGLQPGTTYYYCLEAGNGYSSARSESHAFTTLPNVAPTVSGITRLNQGPLSITVSYEITDDGGEAITATGVYYRKEGDVDEQCLSLDADTGQEIHVRIGGLETEADYILQAYAANSMGETRSEAYRFHTSQAVVLTEAGKLAETVGEAERYGLDRLSIVGPLNGTDFRFLRDMMGRGVDGEETPGQLRNLDLSDATIVTGGASYDGHHYTANRTAGSLLFGQCTALETLKLPDDTETVEANALSGCTALRSLRLPSALTSFSPSDGCINLAQIEVPESCLHFSTLDGVLYDEAATTLLWYPEGKKAQVFTVPSSVQTVGEQAFRNAPADEIILPQSVTKLGQGAFCGSAMQRIDLPDGISTLPYACFQDCQRLKSIRLGSGMSYVSEYCFSGCASLTDLSVESAEFAPYCTEESFADTGQLLQSATLHVPAGRVSLYRNHPVWGLFKTIVDDL